MTRPRRTEASWTRWFVGWPFMTLLVAASLAMGDVAPLVALDATMRSHEPALLATTGGIALGGFVAFFIGVFLLILDSDADTTGRETGGQQVRGLAALRRFPAALRGTAYRFSGDASTAQAEDVFSIADLKRAGAKLRGDPVARRRALAVLGGLLMVLGGFACAFVAVPRSLKPLLGLCVLYGAARLGWAYYRAK